MSPLRAAVAGAALAAGAAGAGCGAALDRAVTPNTSPGTAAPASAEGKEPAQLLGTLVVAPEVDPGGYDRDRFDYPQGGTDSRGCSTRALVLIRDSLDPAQVAYPGCKVLAGRWVDPYTGAVYTSPAEVSIDHVVPLKEAWRSGAASWPTERMVAFANDIAHRDALAVVEGSGNEQKGDKDPARWRPADPARWRTYASGWVAVKATWGLTVDVAERAALQAMLSAAAPAPAATTTSAVDVQPR